jgi:hypothetical protein
VGPAPTDSFARRCLLARKFVEAGTRFVQVIKSDWDAHDGIAENHGKNFDIVDRPIAGLLADLQQRGLLESTLVALWITDALSHPAIIGLFRCQLAGTHGNDKWFLDKGKRTYLRDDGSPFPTFADTIREANRAALERAYGKAVGS